MRSARESTELGDALSRALICCTCVGSDFGKRRARDERLAHLDEQLGLNTGAALGDALFGAAGVQRKPKGDVYVDKYVGACPWYKYPTAWEMAEHEQQRIAQLRKTADDQMAALAATTTTGVLCALQVGLCWANRSRPCV